MIDKTCLSNNRHFSPFALLLFVGLFAQRASAIMVPDNARDEYLMEINSTSVFTEILYHQDNRREFSNTVPCFESFVDMYFKGNDRVSVYVVDPIDDLPDSINFLLQHLPVPKYMLHGVLQSMAHYNTSESVLIFMENATSLYNSWSHYLYLCRYDCRFLIVMTSTFSDEGEFLEEVDNVIEIMWSYSVARIKVLGRVLDTVQFAQSVSFSSEEACFPAASIVLGKCKSHVWDLEGLDIIRAMNNCFVNVAFFENYPYASLVNDTEEVIGIDGILMKEVVMSLHAQLDIDQIAWTNDIQSELSSRLNSTGEFDMVCGGLIWKPNNEIDFTVSYDMTEVAWMIPEMPNVSLRGLITPFSTKVWIASIVAMIFGISVRVVLIQDITLLDIFAIVVGVSTNKQPTKTPTRIKYMSWVLFSFLLCQFYLATLAVQLLNEQSSFIETTAELVSSGLKLGGPYDLQEVFQANEESDNDEEDSNIISYIQRNFISFDRAEYLNKLADLKAGRNSSLALIVMTNSTVIKSKGAHFHGYIMKESLGSFPLALATWRGVPYLRQINHQILSLIQGGFINLWAETFDSEEELFHHYDEFAANLLGIKQLIPALLLLSIGYGLATILFIVEIIAYPSKWLE